MIVGIDFDNTIVCYDDAFYKEAVVRCGLPENIPPQKELIRNYFRKAGKEDIWTELQGFVYGPGMKSAKPFPGILEFLNHLRSQRIKTYIISHKTRFPYAGPSYDLHESALAWLFDNGLFETSETGLSAADVFFNPTKDGKILQILQTECSCFIDDLPEFLGADNFPVHVHRVLFDPNSLHLAETRFARISSWADAYGLAVGEPAR